MTFPDADATCQLVGRADDWTAAPEKTLPPAFGKGADYDSLIKLFEAKGINARELAALMGAHTVSRSFAEQQRGSIPWGSELTQFYYSSTEMRENTDNSL